MEVAELCPSIFGNIPSRPEANAADRLLVCRIISQYPPPSLRVQTGDMVDRC